MPRRMVRMRASMSWASRKSPWWPWESEEKEREWEVVAVRVEWRREERSEEEGVKVREQERQRHCEVCCEEADGVERMVLMLRMAVGVAGKRRDDGWLSSRRVEVST